MAALFREEAISHQSHKLDGEVTIATHTAFTRIAVFLVAIVFIGVLFLLWGEYHRKEVVSGYLRPTSGLNKVYPVAHGLIEEIFVSEGDSVSKGQVLAKIKLDREISSGTGANDAIIQQLQIQKALITQNIANKQHLFETDYRRLEERIKYVASTRKHIQLQHELLLQRISIHQRKVEDLQSLTNAGFTSQKELENQQDLLLTLEQQREKNTAQILESHENLKQLHHQLNQLPIKHNDQIGSLNSQLVDINKHISQTEAQRSVSIVSPKDGVVTNLLVNTGTMANTGRPLMTIMPKDALFEAVLYVPTRAYGFVVEGQQTRIRYHAFPYQRFGLYEGNIKAVSKTVILPNETTLPVAFNEPVYQVIVELKHQWAEAYGDTIPLQSGMLLEADIMIDKRSLFDWLFDPIISVKGKLK